MCAGVWCLYLVGLTRRPYAKTDSKTENEVDNVDNDVGEARTIMSCVDEGESKCVSVLRVYIRVLLCAFNWSTRRMARRWTRR